MSDGLDNLFERLSRLEKIQDDSRKAELISVFRQRFLQALEDHGAAGVYDAQDGGGSTLFSQASAKGLDEVVKLLLSEGIKHNIDRTLFELPNNERQSPLHRALKKGNFSVVRLLSEYGVISPLAKNEDGNNAIHCIANAKNVDAATKIAIINILVDKLEGNDRRSLLNERNNGGDVPIKIFVGKAKVGEDSIEVISHLLSLRDNDGSFVTTLNSPNNRGQTALDRAYENQHTELADVLISHEARTAAEIAAMNIGSEMTN